MAQPATLTTDVVFVYGALRSGTTLFRLMLEAHPGITNPGEADFLFDHLTQDSAGGWRYDRQRLAADRIFLAKGLALSEGLDGLDLLADLLRQFEARGAGRVVTLNLHRNLDLLLRILPAARVIHMIRDPRDVAQSSIGMGWAGTLYHGVNHWMRTEGAWDAHRGRLAPDQVFEFTYETLFVDVEATLRRVCAFVGRDYDPIMLDYHKSTTYGPPDASLVNQWKRRANRAELAPLEAKAAPLMKSRGYALSGPLAPPGRLTRALLAVKNKIAVWRFGIARFGVALILAEKLSRRLGATGWHRRFQEQMSKIVVKHLK